MEWFIAVVAVAALGAAAIAASGGMGQMSQDPVYDTFRQDQPETALTAADLEHLRLGVALRGYAMDQVDDLLGRLGREIAERDDRLAAQAAEIARLTGSAPPADVSRADDPPTIDPRADDPPTIDPRADDPPTIEQPVVVAAGHAAIQEQTS